MTFYYADVAESGNASVSKTDARKGLQVQILPSAQNFSKPRFY